MNDQSMLLAAIIALPEEDLPRLMYADWLEENGQPERAEFIRLECRMARATEFDWADDKRWGELCLIAERENWTGDLPQFQNAQWEFCRGMPERLTLRADSLHANYQHISELLWLRELHLYDVMNWDVHDLVRRQWNPNWVGLFIGEHPMSGIIVQDYDNTPSLVGIANCSQARRLRKLQFSMFSYSEEGIRALAESPYFEKLDKLGLEGDLDSPAFEPLRARFGSRLVKDAFGPSHSQ